MNCIMRLAVKPISGAFLMSLREGLRPFSAANVVSHCFNSSRRFCAYPMEAMKRELYGDTVIAVIAVTL